jgi:hypothetical protein
VTKAISPGSRNADKFIKCTPGCRDVCLHTAFSSQAYLGRQMHFQALTANCDLELNTNQKSKPAFIMAGLQLVGLTRVNSLTLRAYTKATHQSQTIQTCQHFLVEWNSSKIVDPAVSEPMKTQGLEKLVIGSDGGRDHALNLLPLLTSPRHIDWMDGPPELGPVRRPVWLIDAKFRTKSHVLKAAAGNANNRFGCAKNDNTAPIKQRVALNVPRNG